MMNNVDYQISKNDIDLIDEDANRFEMEQLLRKTINKMIKVIRNENQN